MPKRTITVVECDVCSGDVKPDADTYVDASTYGVVFHEECFATLAGATFARLLGLDDIRRRDVATDEQVGARVWSRP